MDGEFKASLDYTLRTREAEPYSKTVSQIQNNSTSVIYIFMPLPLSSPFANILPNVCDNKPLSLTQQALSLKLDVMVMSIVLALRK